MFYPQQTYKLKGFRKSRSLNKKYDAILLNITNDTYYMVPFGDTRYPHYKDMTGLDMYPDHEQNDLVRRYAYRRRHRPYLKPGFYSSGYFSYHYLN